MTDISPQASAAYEAWLATPEGQAAVNAPAAAVPAGIIPPPPPAAVADPPAAPAAAPAIDYAELAKALVSAGAVPTSEAPAAPAPIGTKDPVPTNQFVKGNIVKHEYDSPYDGQVTRYGIVIDVLADEGAGARSSVAWFEDPSSIGDQYLSAV
jgi:hypothetical protein